MTLKKQKCIIVLGSTATGKSDFAVTLAKQFNGEIISADSRQVYRGLDIGSGKITKEEMQNVPHHLLDVVNPTDEYSVARFVEEGRTALEEIWRRGHTPIICGGTGFYIDALIGKVGLTEVGINIALRKSLEEKTTEELFALLKEKDPSYATKIDPKNKVRLIRALEIAEELGSVPENPSTPLYDTFTIGLTLPDEILRQKIHTRLISRMQNGMMEEMENVHAEGLSYERMEALGLEYRFGAYLLQGKLTEKEMLEQLEFAIWHYAKRQKTWFKRDHAIHWIDPRNETEKSKLQNILGEFLEQ